METGVGAARAGLSTDLLDNPSTYRRLISLYEKILLACCEK
jgi:hypothetical protein